MRLQNVLKRLVLIALLFSLPTHAVAEIVGQAGGDPSVSIYRHVAPNGQSLYFLTQESEPYIFEEDVNFDGHDDIVVITALGASNFFRDFFLWQDGQYVPAQRNAHLFPEPGLPNVTLMPEQGFLISEQISGLAGLLREKCVFRWDGDMLLLVRRAVIDYTQTTIFEDKTSVTVTNYDSVTLTVTACVYGEGERTDAELLSQTLPLEEAEANAQALFNAFEQALWDGLL